MKLHSWILASATVAVLFSGCAGFGVAEDDPSIVFSGTVIDVGKTRVPPMIWESRAVRVRVDEIHEKPSSVAMGKGSIVVVQCEDPSNFEPGVIATFHTRGLVFGDRIYLGEVSHERISSRDLIPSVVNATRDRQQDAQGKRLQERVDAAEVVLYGKVQEIREPAKALSTLPAIITEHAPMWREAVIQCDKPLKGIQLNDRVVVRFPASMDVMWSQYPRLRKGQQSLFMLRKDALHGDVKSMIGANTVSAYMLNSAADVLPESAIESIQALLKR